MLAFCRRYLCWIVIAHWITTTAAAANGVVAIETDGSGALTMCRAWILFNSCKVYSHVALPKRVAIGDEVELSFGSENKQYTFPVVRIIKHGVACTVLSENNDIGSINRINLSSCLDVSGAAH
ncbi:MAG TPA: hypothetical protein VMI30_13005 [Stellaceae bacterium]|nr:hypothetical protein [Stellaceae bacterium]